MRVRLWLKSTRISVATCQKERIVRRYFSLHWGAGACPANKCGIATKSTALAVAIQYIKAFSTPRALKKTPLRKPYCHSLLFCLLERSDRTHAACLHWSAHQIVERETQNILHKYFCHSQTLHKCVIRFFGLRQYLIILENIKRLVYYR